jgi:hypothetical protein
LVIAAQRSHLFRAWSLRLQTGGLRGARLWAEAAATARLAPLTGKGDFRKGLIAPFHPYGRHFRPAPINRHQQTCLTSPAVASDLPRERFSPMNQN